MANLVALNFTDIFDNLQNFFHHDILLVATSECFKERTKLPLRDGASACSCKRNPLADSCKQQNCMITY